MQNPTPADIGDAVRRCLARVSAGSTPLGVIAEFLGELRAQGWNEESIRAVDSAVRKVLMGLVEADQDPTFVQ